MNTTELKAAIQARLGKVFDPPLTSEDTGFTVDATFDEITGGILTEGKVSVRGFGTFKLTERKGRTYSVRGKSVDVPNRWTVTFKPGTELVRAVKETKG